MTENSVYELVKESDGFKPCPICERLDKVQITTLSNFCESAVEGGYYLIHMWCDRCNLNLWSHDCNGKNYGSHKNYIRRRWNKMWTRGQMEGEDDGN